MPILGSNSGEMERIEGERDATKAPGWIWTRDIVGHGQCLNP